MKKSFLFILILALGASRLLADNWSPLPPASVTVGTTVNVTAQISIPPQTSLFVNLWTQAVSGGPWTSSVMAMGSGTVTGGGSRTLYTPGTYIWQIWTASSPPSGSTPSGQQRLTGTTNVISSAPTPVTFNFSNLTHTYDGTVKWATVTTTPANATINSSLSGGPAVGSYTVTASAYGNFSGSGTATLTIHPAVPNHIPVVSWQVIDSNGSRSGATHPAQFVPSGNYTVQASGYSDVGQLVNVIVWKDGAPLPTASGAPIYTTSPSGAISTSQALAYNGGGNGYSNRTDPNTVTFTGGGKVHLFSAQAVSKNGSTYLYSPVIYWLVKESATSGAFAFSDLAGLYLLNPQPNSGVTRNQNQNAWFPNVGDCEANTFILNGVVSSFSSDSNQKSLEFSSERYNFDNRQVMNPDGYQISIHSITAPNGQNYTIPTTGGGYMQPFYNVHNLLVIGTHGSTTLDWGVRDQNGTVIQPTSYPSLFVPSYDNNPLCPYPFDSSIENGEQGTAGIQPHHFFFIDQTCSNFIVKGITFSTDYNTRIGPDGCHIKLNGAHHQITDCEFNFAPGFSVFIGMGGAASYVNVDSSRFFGTWADGLHAGNLSNPGANLSDPSTLSYFTGNAFYETGDDAISINGSSVNGLVVQNNSISNSHSRGIMLGAGSNNPNNISIKNNTISHTGQGGIQIGKDGLSYVSGTEQPIASSYLNKIYLSKNYVEYTGFGTDAHGDTATPHSGYELIAIHSLTADFTAHDGYSIPCANVSSGTGAFLSYLDGGIYGKNNFTPVNVTGSYAAGTGATLTDLQAPPPQQ